MHRNLVLLVAILFVATSCQRRKQHGSDSRNTDDPKSQLIQEAIRLGVRESPEYREKLNKLSNDLLVEELFRQWAEEDTRPENVVKCYQDHKEVFAKHYRRVYGLVDPAAKNGDALLEWRRNLQKGEDFRLLAATGCKADYSLCGVRGDLGYLDVETWLKDNGLVECAGSRVTLKDQELYGPCKTAQGYAYFMLGDERVTIPTLEELGKSLQARCVTIGRASRISSFGAPETSLGISDN